MCGPEVCVHLCGWMYSPVCALMEAKSQLLVPSTFALHLIFWDVLVQWTGSCQFQLDWLSTMPLGSSCGCPTPSPTLGLQARTVTPRFYLDTGIQAQVLTPVSTKHFTPWATFPTLDIRFSETNLLTGYHIVWVPIMTPGERNATQLARSSYVVAEMH